ncbi:MAG TPA: DUF1761 domain-containing protein [Candidatus Paceibacterota bacterium]
MINILVGAAALFVFGAIWFTFLFGKTWEKLSQFSPEVKEKMKERGMAMGLVGNFILNAITVCVVYTIFSEVLALSFSDFFKFLLTIWAGFSLPLYANEYFWGGKSWKLVLLNSAQGLGALLIVSLIVYYWPR